MLNPCSEIVVEIEWGDEKKLIINAESDIEANTLLVIPQELAVRNGEEEIQLLEGCSYEYELPTGYELEVIPRVIHPSRSTDNQHRGRITPGLYVGRLLLTVFSAYQRKNIAVEVRSVKAEYRSEYRKMLSDITAECTDLLMQHSSPASQRVSVDFEGNSQTLYQRFAFVKSIVDSDEFKDAVQRILSMPVTAWHNRTEDLDIRRSGRIGSRQIRQIASRSNRINLPDNHPLSPGIRSVPSRVTTEIKFDTVNTPENRFVKYALKEFERFCSSLCRHIEMREPDISKRPNIYHEAEELRDSFAEYLSHDLFREVLSPTLLPLNSPVLQRKEGYREVLRVWLMYDLAAKLVWNGIDADAYQVGKRDVAVLYEYWLFFKLLRLVEDIFDIDPKETSKLIKKTEDGLGLQLLAGKHTAIEGKYSHKGRMLNIKFNYNRTFSQSKYPNSGSWTQAMRPDYTLSIWPTVFSETEAEEQELIVHVHFDAKYKVEGLSYLLSSNEGLSDDGVSERLTEEKNKQKEGTYKRADLLKMHAYKDAIRRTAGAYLLYPGTAPYERHGFHEIIPGLGAFPISPSDSGDGLEDIRQFIHKIIEHISNRASQSEQLSYYNYDIHKNAHVDKIQESMPEYTANRIRVKSPNDSTVLVGYYNANQYQWISDYGLYNIRIDPNKGLVKYSSDITGAKYLLLHGKGELETSNIWEIISTAPRLISKKELLESHHYPGKGSSENYLLFELKAIKKKKFGRKKWDIRKLNGYLKGHASARPFAVSLTELSQAIVVE